LKKNKRDKKTVDSKDQYYTSDAVVDKCLEAIKPYVNAGTTLLEPAGGTGQFIKGFKRHLKYKNVVALDIEPKHPDVIKGNFLEIELPAMTDFVCVTNPPFGRNSSLSAPFFNRAATVSRVIGFLVTKAWRKWSIQDRLNPYFHLVADIDLPTDCPFIREDGSVYEGGILNTVFQVWERRDYKRLRVTVEDRGYFKQTTPEEADVTVVGFGNSVGKVETKFDRIPNTTKYFFKVKNKAVITAFKKIDVTRFSTLAAYTPVVSMRELNFLLNEYFDNARFK